MQNVRQKRAALSSQFKFDFYRHQTKALKHTHFNKLMSVFFCVFAEGYCSSHDVSNPPPSVCLYVCVCVCERGFKLNHDFCSPQTIWKSMSECECVCVHTVAVLQGKGNITIMSGIRQNAKQKGASFS